MPQPPRRIVRRAAMGRPVTRDPDDSLPSGDSGIAQAEAIAREMANRKFQMLEALKQTMCVVTEAADMIGISDRTHRQWMANDPEYKQAVLEMRDRADDIIEGCLFKAAKDKVPAVLIFLAKTRLRHRGYTEKIEVTTTVPNSGGAALFSRENLDMLQNELPPTSVQSIIAAQVQDDSRVRSAIERLRNDQSNRA